jgi:mitochondrial import receptor subunit TOM70
MLLFQISINLSNWILINLKYGQNELLSTWKKVPLLPPASLSFSLGWRLIVADREAAMKDFAKAIEIDPLDPDVYYHRGQVRFLMGDFSDAATDYQKSAELDKKFVYSQVQLGVAQYKLGQIKDSLVTFRKCLKNFKNSAEVYNYYGEILLDQGQFQEALDKFETAIELERSGSAGKKVRNIMPLINRAVLYLQWKKDGKEAERNLRDALKCNIFELNGLILVDPESDLAMATLAQLLLQEGRAPEALEYFDKSVELGRTEQELVSALSYAEVSPPFFLVNDIGNSSTIGCNYKISPSR